MPRRAAIWARKGRAGFYATIQGKQVFLGLERESAAREFHRLKAAGRPVEQSSLTVTALVRLYVIDTGKRTSATTVRLYHWFLRRWCSHAGTLVASELKPYHLTGWLDRHPGWGSSTKRQAISYTRTWSKWCKEQGYLEVDPFTRVKRPAITRRKAADPEAIERFLARISGTRFHDYCMVLLDTGARPGEIRGLEASRIDWGESTAIVVGKTGERRISLTTRTLEILARCRGQSPIGPLLRNRDGNPWQANTVRSQFRRVSKALGVEICPYQFRHAFWSRATKAGVDSIIIARQLGHRSGLGLLLSTYAHVDMSQTKEGVERASGLIESIPAAQAHLPQRKPSGRVSSSSKPRKPRRTA